ncbi:RDD family protein [Ruminiclostridium sufflavum DSM 19573]|uniref:RDD family protein n=1 Tax=Ruminiclostridium sufflavum DSM 19573 TaxID=1121337 RepID=A0A318XPD6_9FIRM|nr:DUF6557 family protein [Ruminiclostridium sufflavum]PYG89030.1 RDD family protein [Ruminiclostridium sufflavum DSM 19573]
MTNSLRENLLVLKDDELRKIIYVEYAEYEQDAINRAREELYGRESGRLWESSGIIFKDLFECADSEEIINSFLQLFPEGKDTIDGYRDIIELLINAKAENTSSISIVIDDQSKSFANKNCNVYGSEDATHERLCMDYFYPKEWLEFRVKKEQLQKFGIETYIAYCLRAMTAMGFTEDEIKEKFYFLEKQDSIKNLQTLYPNIKEDKSNIFILYGFPKIKQYINNEEDFNNYPEASQIKPVVRYLARAVDFGIWTTLLFFLWASISPATYTYAFSNILTNILARVFLYVPWLFAEALLLSKVGYTLGKWLLKIKVTGKSGEKPEYGKALRRAAGVFVYGCGMQLPYVCTIAYVFSYNKLMKDGIMKWDRDGGTAVYHGEYSTFRGIIAVIVFLLPALISYRV